MRKENGAYLFRCDEKREYPGSQSKASGGLQKLPSIAKKGMRCVCPVWRLQHGRLRLGSQTQGIFFLTYSFFFLIKLLSMLQTFWDDYDSDSIYLIWDFVLAKQQDINQTPWQTLNLQPPIVKCHTCLTWRKMTLRVRLQLKGRTDSGVD